MMIPIPDIEPFRNKKYRIEKDTNGMSPAEVYKIHSENEVLFLKRINRIYHDTTYDTKREMNIIRWLSNQINIPEIVHYEEDTTFHTLVMSKVEGVSLEELEDTLRLEDYIDYLVKALKLIQAIPIDNCPYNNCIHNRLNELQYLLDHNLADTEIENWEEDTPFDNATDLVEFLRENQPQENLVLSHGDFCNSNIFINKDQISFIDLGRVGLADLWLDIAFCVRDIREHSKNKKWIQYFFEKLELTPDWNKIKYYLLLDELF